MFIDFIIQFRIKFFFINEYILKKKVVVLIELNKDMLIISVFYYFKIYKKRLIF